MASFLPPKSLLARTAFAVGAAQNSTGVNLEQSQISIIAFVQVPKTTPFDIGLLSRCSR